MTQEIEGENKDVYKMVAVKVQKDHREDKHIEFNIDPSFYEDVITVLGKFENMTKQKQIKEQVEAEEENKEEEFQCEFGYENCDHSDPESMSDECKQQMAEDYDDARMDTYD